MLSNSATNPLYRLHSGKQISLLPAVLVPRSKGVISQGSRCFSAGLRHKSFRPLAQSFTHGRLLNYTVAIRYFSSSTRNMSNLPLSVELTAPNGTKWTQPTGRILLLPIR